MDDAMAVDSIHSLANLDNHTDSFFVGQMKNSVFQDERAKLKQDRRAIFIITVTKGEYFDHIWVVNTVKNLMFMIKFGQFILLFVCLLLLFEMI